MELCSHEHNEICYTSPTCPACDLAQTLKERDEEIKELEKELEKIKEQNEELKEHVDLNVLKKDW